MRLCYKCGAEQKWTMSFSLPALLHALTEQKQEEGPGCNKLAL